MRRGRQFDIAALRLQFHGLRELLELDVAGACYQAYRTHHILGAEFAQVHADPSRDRLRAQFRAARPFQLQRFGEVLEIERAAVSAVDGYRAPRHYPVFVAARYHTP